MQKNGGSRLASNQSDIEKNAAKNWTHIFAWFHQYRICLWQVSENFIILEKLQ